ncbi:hypothetical protein FLAN108750_11265 [Flavobacterium antarcticum]
MYNKIQFFAKSTRREFSLYAMKKLLIPAVIVAAIVLLYEQSQAVPNVYISAGSIVVFMFLLYKLNARIPHKNNNNKDTDDVQ